MFSSPSYAKWTKAGENEDGNPYYVVFERMKKHKGYVYYWSLQHLVKSSEPLFIQSYVQGDCNLGRKKVWEVHHTPK